MVAGNTTTIASKSYCDRQYWIARNTQLYWSLQNTWTYPTATAYVQRLLKEAPWTVEEQPLFGQLAVLTNIAKDGSSFFVAVELALTMNMDLCIMGKNLKKLRHVEAMILDEHRKRRAHEQALKNVKGTDNNNNNTSPQQPTPAANSTGSHRVPKIFKVKYDDTHSIAAVQQAAHEVLQIVNSPEHDYAGKIPILLHNPSGVAMTYDTTVDGIESNVARNYVAPFVLTQELLPAMERAAINPETTGGGSIVYKPRVVFVSSVGHSQGTDFDPQRFLAVPQEGGAPEGTFQDVLPEDDDNCDAANNQDDNQTDTGDENNNNTTTTTTTTTTGTKKAYVENELDGPVIMYYRSKMALQANARALAQELPWLAPVSVYPGSVVTTSSSKSRNLGIAEMIYQTGFSAFQLDPTQAARASLRAALDPDFNNSAVLPGGTYLHCDGNPWTMAYPTVEKNHDANEATSTTANDKPCYYTLEEYCAKVRECTKTLCAMISEHQSDHSTVITADESTAFDSHFDDTETETSTSEAPPVVQIEEE